MPQEQQKYADHIDGLIDIFDLAEKQGMPHDDVIEAGKDIENSQPGLSDMDKTLKLKEIISGLGQQSVVAPGGPTLPGALTGIGSVVPSDVPELTPSEVVDEPIPQPVDNTAALMALMQGKADWRQSIAAAISGIGGSLNNAYGGKDTSGPEQAAAALGTAALGTAGGLTKENFATRKMLFDLMIEQGKIQNATNLEGWKAGRHTKEFNITNKRLEENTKETRLATQAYRDAIDQDRDAQREMTAEMQRGNLGARQDALAASGVAHGDVERARKEKGLREDYGKARITREQYEQGMKLIGADVAPLTINADVPRAPTVIRVTPDGKKIEFDSVTKQPIREVQ